MTDQYRTISEQAAIDHQSTDEVLHRAACGEFELQWWLPGGVLVRRVSGSKRKRARPSDAGKFPLPMWTKWTEVPNTLTDLSGEDARFRLDLGVYPFLAAWLESGCAESPHLEIDLDLRSGTRFLHRDSSDWVWQLVPNGGDSYRRLPRTSELRIVVRDQGRRAAQAKKLQAAQEDEIVRLFELGESVTGLASKFGVSRRTVDKAIKSAKARRGTTLETVVAQTWTRPSQGIAPKSADKPPRR